MIIIISITLFFIVLRFTVTLFNFISNPKLTRVNKSYTDLVSILIPVRNEEDNILRLLKSIHQQDYKNYEVIIYDDESTDNTYKICREFADSHPLFTIIKGNSLPDGWAGKNYACNQLAGNANGKYFLFIDANEIISNSLLNSVVHRMQLHKLGLLSIFINHDMPTIGEKATLPLLDYILLSLLPLRLVYLVKSAAISVASGSFMLFDAAIYRQNNWHQQVRNRVAESTEIMRLLKSATYNGEVLLANGLVKSAEDKSYKEIISSFSRHLIAAFNYSIPALFIYILVLIGGPMIVIMTLNFNLIFFMSGLIILMRVMISLSAGQNALYNIVLHPLQMINLAIVVFLSVQKYLTKTNTWKERKV